MTKRIDPIDWFYERHSVLAWTLTAVAIIAVAAINYVTKSDKAMLLLALPGLYVIGRGGLAQLIRFVVGMTLLGFVFYWLGVHYANCDSAFGQGYQAFLGNRC